MISPPWPSPADRDSGRRFFAASRAVPAARLRRTYPQQANEPALGFVPESPYAPREHRSPAGHAKKRTRAAPSDRSPSRWPRARSPLSTGCPGPFQAQPPVQPDERGQLFLPVLVPRLAQERLAAVAAVVRMGGFAVAAAVGRARRAVVPAWRVRTIRNRRKWLTLPAGLSRSAT